MNGRRLLALLPLMGSLWFGSALAADPPTTASAADGTTGAPATTAVVTPPADGTAAVVPVDDTHKFTRELLTTEQDVDKLKERVFRSKATLQLLKELVLEGSSLGSSVVLWHVNKMGAGYSLQSMQFFLDGKNVFARMDAEGGLDAEKEMMVYEQPVTPGPHNLQVNIALRGNGFGVFSYLQSYSFKLQSSYSFNVEDGQQTTVRVVSDEKGGIWRTFVDRPNVEYQESSERLKKETE
jgi:hypothetical protein